jgi:nucleoside-diphosphate-sugar epimerase
MRTRNSLSGGIITKLAMAVLVTGSGLVGCQVARLLVEGGDRPVLLDLAPQRDAVADIVDPGRLTLVQGDLLNPLDPVRVLKNERITHVIHTAANPLLTVGAQRQPFSAIQVNIMATVNVLEAARVFGVERVVFTSSSVLSHYLVGGEDRDDARKEEAYPRPSTFYAATKQAAENLGLCYARSFGVDFVAVRYAAVVGPWRGRGGGGGPSQTFRELVERSLAGQEAALPRRRMEWLYSKDAAAAALLALRAKGLKSRVFNIGSGRVVSADDVAAAVTRVIPGARIRLDPPDADAPAPDMSQPLDLSRARAELGYAPAYDLEAAINDYVAWHRATAPRSAHGGP